MSDEKGLSERRIFFLKTCFDVFCKNGLENTSLRMLAEAMRLGQKPTLLLRR